MFGVLLPCPRNGFFFGEIVLSLRETISSKKEFISRILLGNQRNRPTNDNNFLFFLPKMYIVSSSNKNKNNLPYTKNSFFHQCILIKIDKENELVKLSNPPYYVSNEIEYFVDHSIKKCSFKFYHYFIKNPPKFDNNEVYFIFQNPLHSLVQKS